MNEDRAIERRLERLERQVRAWRLATFAIAALLMAMAFSGAVAARQRYLSADTIEALRANLMDLRVTRAIEATEIRIVDSDGHVRAELGLGLGGILGHPQLELRNGDGKGRVVLSAEGEEASLYLGVGDAKPSVRLWAARQAHAPSGLFVSDDDGKSRIDLEVGPSTTRGTSKIAGITSLSLKDENEKTGLYASSPDWGGQVEVTSTQGRASLVADLRDLHTSEPILEFWSYASKSPRLRLGLDKNGPFVRVLGPDGSVTWEPKPNSKTERPPTK